LLGNLLASLSAYRSPNSQAREGVALSERKPEASTACHHRRTLLDLTLNTLCDATNAKDAVEIPRLDREHNRNGTSARQAGRQAYRKGFEKREKKKHSGVRMHAVP